MYLKSETKNDVQLRLVIITGQIKGIKEMMGKEKYCMDIFTQIEAVRKAISEMSNIILKNHLENNIVRNIRNRREKNTIQQIIKIYKSV